MTRVKTPAVIGKAQERVRPKDPLLTPRSDSGQLVFEGDVLTPGVSRVRRSRVPVEFRHLFDEAPDTREMLRRSTTLREAREGAASSRAPAGAGRRRRRRSYLETGPSWRISRGWRL